MKHLTEAKEEELLNDYLELLKKVLKSQWKKGRYSINTLAEFKKSRTNPPSSKDFKMLETLLNEK